MAALPGISRIHSSLASSPKGVQNLRTTLLAFDAAMVARMLRGFSEQWLDRMELMIDTETCRLALRVTGLKEACELLAEHGMVEGRHYKLTDAIDCAGMIILEMESENEG
jgi:hypothetical protein